MADAYLTDTPYTWGFYSELNPVFLNYVVALNGYKPRALDVPFSYFDLGCGNGVSAIAFAQMFPSGTFTGVDFNQEHVAAASALAADAKLANTRFLEGDLGALEPLGLGEFDFIVLHGVWSWVDPETRNAMREFLAKHVKPDGIVYVSYDCMPGWAALAPIRDLMLQHTRDLVTNAETKARAGLDFLRYLRDRKAGFFTDNPPLSSFLDEISKQDIRYVAHEFFGAAVKPYYFQQVAAEMRSAALRFAGSAMPFMNFIDLAVPNEFRELLVGSASRLDFEQNGDYIRNQRFRKDVYVRGEASLDAKSQTQVLSTIPFGTTCDAESFRRIHRFVEVELKFSAEVFGRIVAHCASGSKTATQLAQFDDLKSYGPDLILDAIRFLSAGGELVPFGAATEAPSAAALAAERYTLGVPFNLALLKARLFHQPALALVSSAAQIGMEVATADALFALTSVEAPRDGVANWTRRRLMEAGQEITDSSALDKALADFRAHKLAKYLELGILAPA